MATKFKEWFENKLTVGAFPYKVNTQFEAADYGVVINVSDEFYMDIFLKLESEMLYSFWFPMNEHKKDIGLNSIYGAMVILWNAEHKNESVYLHCHAGVNRSKIVKAAYYYLRTGTQLEENRSGFINMMLASCGRGYLPPKSEMEVFLNEIGKQLKQGIQGGSLDMCKVGKINNF